MGNHWLGLVVIAALASLVLKSEPASAASAAAFAIHADLSAEGGAERIAFYHHHRKYSFYCYPRNYWWFYRPYTTAVEGYARCMPYFHPVPGRGAKPYVK